MENRFFLGIDGGGSKTTAVVFDSDGVLAACAVGESINWYSIGLSAARANMSAVLLEIAQKSGVSAFEAAVIGMSALGERATDKELYDFANGVVEAKHIYMDSDLYIALQALNAQGECAVVISGTGSMAAVRTEGGAIIHAGGWGHILGDEGSGYCLGLDGIKAAIAASEGYGEKTALYGDCLAFFEIDNIYDLIDLYYVRGVSRKKTAAFARNVRSRAGEGDAAALGIMKTAAQSLAQTALSVLKSVKKDSPVGLWGGIFQNSPLYIELFKEGLAAEGFANVKLLDFTPEVGAVFAAYRLAGVDITENVLNNIKNSYSH